MTESIQRWIIEARGEVQRVGYRDFVDGIAIEMGLAGALWNDRENRHLVHIEAQGPAPKLSTFVEAIRGKHGPIDARVVHRVNTKDPDPTLSCFRAMSQPPP